MINLPASNLGYYIAYSRCCWSEVVLNIQDPKNNGITITSFIPPTSTVNSNPRYLNYPPLILCANQKYTFNHAAMDSDGDSLSYKVITPFRGGSTGNSKPDPEDPPPFPLSLWETGFSEILPFGNNSIVSIDSITGMLTFTPNLLGNFVLAIEVSEFRNGIFLSKKSRTFGYLVVSCQIIPPVTVEVISSANQIESCSSSLFIITRSVADTDLLVDINLNGTATNGVDYNLIPAQIIIPIGTFVDTIQITSIYDGIDEDIETVEIEIIITNSCYPDQRDTTTASLNILNYNLMTNNYVEYLEVCEEEFDIFSYGVEIFKGLPPYDFNWNDYTFSNNSTIEIPQNFFQAQDNYLYLTVTDQCNKTLTFNPINLFNQCSLQTPNIITTDGDGINDFFIIKNLEDFEEVSLTVFNRWGNVVYENTNYHNNWGGTAQNGKFLTDGVYFYKVVPKDDKFIYNDKDKLKYTIHGFVQVIHGSK